MKTRFAVPSLLLAAACMCVAAVPVITSLEGCAGTPSGQLIAPSEKLGLCVVQAAVSDLVDAISDPVSLVPAIISACAAYGVADAQSVWSVLLEYLGAAPSPDAGVSLSGVQLARVQRVMSAAKALGAK
jgi:hypothetical protein